MPSWLWFATGASVVAGVAFVLKTAPPEQEVIRHNPPPDTAPSTEHFAEALALADTTLRLCERLRSAADTQGLTDLALQCDTLAARARELRARVLGNETVTQGELTELRSLAHQAQAIVRQVGV